jgi:hypothetical protein
VSAGWVVVDYPAKLELSRSEAMAELSSGPAFDWFRGFAVLGEVRTAQPNRMPYGVVHWYFDAAGTPRQTVRTFRNVEAARWALMDLFRTHQEGCRCAAVFYWTPKTVNYGPEAQS